MALFSDTPRTITGVTFHFPFRGRLRELTKAEFNPLLEGVRKDGVKEPLLVRKREDGSFDLIDGHHRLWAACLLYLHVPASVPLREVEGDDGAMGNLLLSRNDPARVLTEKELEEWRRLESKRLDALAAVKKPRRGGRTKGGLQVDYVALERIDLAGSPQTRAATDEGTVEEFAEVMRQPDGAATFPPVVLFHDDDGTLWLGDGWHRVRAAGLAGLADVPSEIRVGTRRDALRFALSANSTHGRRPTREDRRRAVELALADPEWAGWSDSAVGKLCGVDHKTVAAARRSLGNSQVPERTYTDKHGTTATMKTGNIGKGRKVPVDAAPVAQPVPADVPAPAPESSAQAPAAPAEPKPRQVPAPFTWTRTKKYTVLGIANQMH